MLRWNGTLLLLVVLTTSIATACSSATHQPAEDTTEEVSGASVDTAIASCATEKLFVRLAEHNWSAAIELIEAGADPDAVSQNGNRPWVLARAWPDATQVLEALITAGMTLDVLDQVGYSPLTAATIHDNTASISALLAAGADPDQPDGFGCSAMQLALDNGSNDIVALFITDFRATVCPT